MDVKKLCLAPYEDVAPCEDGCVSRMATKMDRRWMDGWMDGCTKMGKKKNRAWHYVGWDKKKARAIALASKENELNPKIRIQPLYQT